MTDHELDELRLLGEELRTVFAAERTAIATLDHLQLTILADSKQRIAARLVELQPIVTKHPEARALFEAVQVEARATALLAATASKVIHTMLGTEPTGYDRRANRTATTGPAFRNLRAY